MKEDKISLAANWLLEAQHAIIFSGAGISVESGIPTFRGENGLWSKYNPIFLDTTYFRNHPKESWLLIKEIFYDFFGMAKPNEAHLTIAEFEKRGFIKGIITQNIDNLHQEAGSQNVIEFHGTSRSLTCMNCKKNYNSHAFLDVLPPYCPECGGLLKPDFVFFNEPIPQKVHEDSVKNAASADLFILVGTTGEIMPASLIPYVAYEKGARIIEVNIQASKYTQEIVDVFLKGKATEVFLKLKRIINEKIK